MFLTLCSLSHHFQEADKQVLILPQLNQENKLYEELQARVKAHMATPRNGVEPSNGSTTPKVLSPIKKPVVPAVVVKGKAKKK